MIDSDRFHLVEEFKYVIYILKKVEQEIIGMKDKRAQKKVLQSLKRLSETIPNNPEKWQSIKSCEGFNAYELKPKSYRLGCYKYGKYILVVHMWRVQKDSSSEKRKNIEKVCSTVKEVKDEFERFVKRV